MSFTRRLALGAIAGPVVFTLGWLVLPDFIGFGLALTTVAGFPAVGFVLRITERVLVLELDAWYVAFGLLALHRSVSGGKPVSYSKRSFNS